MIVYAILIIANIVFYFFIIPSQVTIAGSAKLEKFSPDTFPRFVTIVFFISAMLGLLNSFRLYRRADDNESTDGETATDEPITTSEGHNISRKLAVFIPYIVFALTLLYGILFAKFGVIIATIIVPPIVLFVIGCKKWHYYVIVYVFAIALFVLFKYLLLVPVR